MIKIGYFITYHISRAYSILFALVNQQISRLEFNLGDKSLINKFRDRLTDPLNLNSIQTTLDSC